ncbi:MAG: succinate dehydrogenase assembly factor 2 [Nitratireductor sp.]|nr:succinate dehydrogenase assembly factor 2 [Nitratireductor sp.]
MQDNRATPMDDTNRRKQLIYRANHRGIKEMDIILGGFAERHVMGLDAESLDRFEAIMAEADRDLLSWFTGELPLPGHIDGPLFEAILADTLAARG